MFPSWSAIFSLIFNLIWNSMIYINVESVFETINLPWHWQWHSSIRVSHPVNYLQCVQPRNFSTIASSLFYSEPYHLKIYNYSCLVTTGLRLMICNYSCLVTTGLRLMTNQAKIFSPLCLHSIRKYARGSTKVKDTFSDIQWESIQYLHVFISQW